MQFFFVFLSQLFSKTEDYKPKMPKIQNTKNKKSIPYSKDDFILLFSSAISVSTKNSAQ